MNRLQIFENSEFGKIRAIEIDGDPWFVGKDVAEALGYVKPTDAARKNVDDEDRGVSKIETPYGTQDMLIINESGLYSLIFSSKLPKAKEFKHWVTSEVLPAIRKTGTYTAQGYRHKATSAGEVTNLIKTLRTIMKDEKCPPQDIARMAEMVCQQFGVQIPDNFVKESPFQITFFGFRG